jgi:rhodanese-related sulfurtransferase
LKNQEWIEMPFMQRLFAAVVAAALLASPAAAQSPVVDAMKEYMEFSTYEAGVIVPQQLSREIFDSVEFIDTRDASQFAKGSIPGARNIEWREVLSRFNDIPRDKKVILFCNTGSLSAQAAFALRVAGRDNVLVLQTGLDGWKKDAAYKP